MRKLNLYVCFFAIAILSGCSTVKRDCGSLTQQKAARALPGTNTAVVGIYLRERDGVPQETYKEVVLHPGQRVLYAGPSEFSINFKNRKTPNGKIRNQAENSVVIIDIPKDIFSRREFQDEYKKNNYLIFDYGITVNGKEYDPPIKVIPDGGNN